MYPKPKKKLSQLFLIDRNIQQKIVRFSELSASDVVLEIGAGSGQISRLIAANVRRLYAVEIDKYLCQVLEENLKDIKNAKIIKEDILKFNIEKYFYHLNTKIKIIGNIPYHISSPLILHLLRFKKNIDAIFITTQKEFAERLTACPGTKEYSALTCFVQYHAEIKILFEIKRTSFFPVPKVDSCFLNIVPRDKPPIKVDNEDLFFLIIRTAFTQRRKMLKNALSDILSKDRLEALINKCGLDMNCRPEDLSLQDFANLANRFLSADV